MGVGREPTQPTSVSPVSSQTGCTRRERGRPCRSTVVSEAYTIRPAVAMNASSTSLTARS